MTLSHDPLYKELIQACFKDFMEFALPEQYQSIDYQSVKFLDKEVFDIFEGIERRLDVLAEASINGQKEIIYIHIEIESSRNNHFPFRMWEYFSLIHRKFRKPVIPIALFVDDQKWKKDLQPEYHVHFMGHDYLSFNYNQIKLKNIDVNHYLHHQNPLIQALLVKMDLKHVDLKKIKLSILRYIFSNKKKIGKNLALIYNFIETYFQLTPNDEQEINQIIIQEQPEAKMLVKTYFQKIEEEGLKKGMEKGLQKGIEEGIEKGLEQGLEKGLKQGLEKGLLKGQTKGVLIGKMEAITEENNRYEKEIQQLKDLLKSKKINKELFDTMAKPKKSQVAKNKKEISLIKNKLKNLDKKKK